MSAAPEGAELGVREPPVPISLTMPRELLARIDRAARRLSITRAAYIKQALSKAVNASESEQG